MDAKKCDRCGCYYDDDNKNTNLLRESEKIRKCVVTPYGVGVCARGVTLKEYFQPFDLCSYCIADFINWFEEDGK